MRPERERVHRHERVNYVDGYDGDDEGGDDVDDQGGLYFPY